MLRDVLLQQFQARLQGLPLRVQTWRGDILEGAGAKVHLELHTPKALKVLTSPTMGGLARAYVEGLIDLKGKAEDILRLGQAFCRADACRTGKGSEAWKWWRHTRLRDRKNIAYHYDVSNDFYSLWLDKNRVYSCAYFEATEDTLDSAQEKKLDLICRKLMLQPGERLLDIGCGWGGLILRAAEHYGVQATGITLSQNQHDYVQEQVRQRGLQGKVEVRLMDYRDVPEDIGYDKIASVGMFEHVGRRNLRPYFDKIARLLRPGGLVMNHGITSVALNSKGLSSGISEFVEQYVFPGGELVHASTVMQEMAAAGIEPLDAENLRPHYGRTLWEWVNRLEARETEAIRMIGEKRYRIWRIYMAGSAFAFDNNWLALFQILGGKPDAAGRQVYPFNRRHVYAT
ncbi:cyclopropane-fatty-acyl-phospholipid synthase [Sulfuritortus calidifontis]|uniref:Cyclopropane-fatty-acyl-phospholipid synthase n=1 Tax=Sulfuritortus calidifontis TaxID=1914471 RepID=A0A4R3K0T8_9PROT|nr:cyclopropane-fatty-acyl-phospholipid synthase family protein [Sulfuritortus calidifontis]TCS73949.1 cyclopropane-fatty-acyl-phospholipid synthase [Sulfuritortus calidifontis]